MSRVRYRRSSDTASGMIVACHIVRRRTRRHGWASRAVSSVAGYGGEDGRRVPYGPSPDRVPYGPSPDRVPSCPCPCRRPRCPCRVHGGASRRPVLRSCLRPNSRVQVTPLARPVTRGVFGARPVPSAVPISMPASGAPDADRWAAEVRPC